MDPSPTIARRALVALFAGAFMVTVSPSGRAQTGEPSVRLNLLSQPVWHGPEDRLEIGLRVSNRSSVTLDGFRLQVRAYSQLTSRSALAAAIVSEPSGIELSSFRHTVTSEVAPGRSTTVRLSQKVGDLTLLGTASSGIYPLTVTLTDLGGIDVLDSVTTFLIYLAGSVEAPLKIVPFWPISELPARGPEGAFLPHPATGAWHLEEAIAERGWITAMIDALQTSAGRRVRLGLVPVPRLVEELQDMSNGYDRSAGEGVEHLSSGSRASRDAAGVISSLASLGTEARVQPLLTPYSFADIPGLADDFARVQVQLAEGEAELDEALDLSPGRGWIFPPAGRLDTDALDALHGLEAAASTVFAPDSLEPLDEESDGCAPPFEGGTYTCPVAAETLGGRARGYVLDRELQDRLVALSSNDGRAELQNLFAEMAMIWAELPSDADRVVPFVVPSALHLRPQAARLFVRTLGRAPWIETLTPREGLHQGIGAGARDPVDELPHTTLANDGVYQLEVDDAADALDDFTRLRPPIRVLQELTRTFLVSQSRSWGSDPLLIDEGIEYARAVGGEIEGEFEKITMGGPDGITLTSRTGEIPFLLRNDTAYEVTLEITISWRDIDLEIERSMITGTYEPGATPVPIQATARGSGVFPVEVALSTVDGTEIDTKLITIRSTEFNEIALAITLGALAFLVLFYVFRAVEHRRRAEK